MRGWLILGAICVFVVILPIIALGGYFGDIARTVGQVVLTVVLLGLLVATGAFGYICIRAQAAKWGAGLVLIAVLCLLAVFWIWTGRILLVI
ncbi:MAG: hypothetical protein QXG10_00395 [Candidatus Hadarchaeales archaeon]